MILWIGFLVFFISSCLGSFFRLVVDRYSTNDSFVFKPSYCQSCKKNLLWWHNIPIISFLILRGKCFFCKSKINPACFISELITAAVGLGIYRYVISNNFCFFTSANFFLFFMTLVLLSMFDIKHRIVPHLITYFVISFFVFYNLFSGGLSSNVFCNLGIAFLFMDFMYFFATLIKKFRVDINFISFPLLLWLVIFSFKQNLLYVIVPICLYFLILSFFKNLAFRIFVLSWVALFFFLLFEIFKLTFIDLSIHKLTMLFSGVGILYFVCEILFYFLSFILFKSKDSGLQQEGSDLQKITIGGGDITVFALISVFLGYKIAFLTLFIASLLALISHFTCKVLGKFLNLSFCQVSNSQYVPFVPYLSTACFIIIVTINGV